ncbi:PX domain-containing protein YPT35 [Talaromyces pinophilus]|nr:PX domain-containing protein YPT35 [Talaromyces pinophilus]
MEHTSDDERDSVEPSAAPVDTNSTHDDHDTNKRNVSEPNSDDTTTTSSISETHDTNGNTNGDTPFPSVNSHLDTNTNTKQARKDRPISGVVPPYWRHQRALSRASLASSVDTHRSSKPAITLEDHTADPNATTTRGLWARSVTIDDHVVVSGKTGIGAYVVWMCNVQTLDGGPMMIPMRYSEFDELRSLLATAFPHARNALPPLPPKSVLFKFRPKFLEQRRIGLQYFLNCVLLNPEFSGSPVLKDFLFSRVN